MDTPTAAPSQGDRVIASFQTGRHGEELRVALSAHRGKTYIATRIWYRTDDGTMRPSSKGVNLKIGLLPGLAAALAKAEAMARSEGLIGAADER